MISSLHRSLSAARRKPLAACCAALFSLTAPAAFASNLIVGSCKDDGSSGTLRNVIAGATSGDTIDMTALNCSYISLTTGAIAIPQSSLTIQGPGVNRFPVSDNQSADAIFYHSGTGTLAINDLHLKFGGGHHYNGPSTPAVEGGCIFSSGSVALTRSRVEYCQAYSTTSTIEAGGGVFATKNLILTNSTISGNYVDAAATIQNPLLFGGGAYVGGNLIAKYSTIQGNLAGFANYGNRSIGGGLFVAGSAGLYNSTLAYNESRYEAGGLWVSVPTTANSSLTINDSTIAKNRAPRVGGVYAHVSTALNNSTIASNYNLAATGNAAGITFAPTFSSITVAMHSTLIADNAYVKFPNRVNDDVGVVTNPNFSITITTDAQQGNFNLIRALDSSVSASSLPPDTIVGQCPMLGQLKNNGGQTQTIALYSGSPAIDAGVNNLGLAYDQRGGPQPVPSPIPPPPLAYDRHSGPRTDIGAYEVQQTDIIFNGGFEGCP